jgi:hypothetical protein
VPISLPTGKSREVFIFGPEIGLPGPRISRQIKLLRNIVRAGQQGKDFPCYGVKQGASRETRRPSANGCGAAASHLFRKLSDERARN